MGISKEIEGRLVMRTDLQLGWVHGCAERCRQERMSIKMPSRAQPWGAFSTAYSRILYSDSVNLQTAILSVFSCVWILCASCACESVWVIGVCVCMCAWRYVCVYKHACVLLGRGILMEVRGQHSWSSSPLSLWNLEIKLQSSGLLDKCFY